MLTVLPPSLPPIGHGREPTIHACLFGKIFKKSLTVHKNKRTVMVKGRWTSQEHADFLEGLAKYGKDWKAIADVVKTRTTVQTRTHHQKYEKQIKKGRKFPEEVRMNLFVVRASAHSALAAPLRSP